MADKLRRGWHGQLEDVMGSSRQINSRQNLVAIAADSKSGGEYFNPLFQFIMLTQVL